MSRIGVASDGNTFLFLLISCYNNTVELSAEILPGRKRRVVEMDNLRQYRISLFGEFTDKSMEDEYLADSLTRSTKLTAYIALVFGSTLGLFLVHSYITERNTPLFAAVAPLRLGFILVSLLLFLLAKTITKPKHLRVMITFYQAIMAIVYLLTLKQYDSSTSLVSWG